MQFVPWLNRKAALMTASGIAVYSRENKKISAIGKQFAAEHEKIEEFCRNKDFKVWLSGGEIRIISHRDCWRIVFEKGKLSLYHRNTMFRKDKKPADITGFHLQACSAKSVMGYLKYIEKHDSYKAGQQEELIIEMKEPAKPEAWIKDKYGEEHPEYPRSRIKGTRRYKKAQKKREKEIRRDSITRVIALIEELGA